MFQNIVNQFCSDKPFELAPLKMNLLISYRLRATIFCLLAHFTYSVYGPSFSLTWEAWQANGLDVSFVPSSSS